MVLFLIYIFKRSLLVVKNCVVFIKFRRWTMEQRQMLIPIIFVNVYNEIQFIYTKFQCELVITCHFIHFLGEKKGIIKCFKLKLLVRFDNPHKIKIFIQLHDILLQMSDKKGWAYDNCNSTSMILFLKYVLTFFTGW